MYELRPKIREKIASQNQSTITFRPHSWVPVLLSRTEPPPVISSKCSVRRFVYCIATQWKFNSRIDLWPLKTPYNYHFCLQYKW
jgi:hypothetical protein